MVLKVQFFKKPQGVRVILNIATQIPRCSLRKLEDLRKVEALVKANTI